MFTKASGLIVTCDSYFKYFFTFLYFKLLLCCCILDTAKRIIHKIGVKWIQKMAHALKHELK